MAVDYEIRRYRPEFLPEIATLQRHLWGDTPAANAVHFEWKHARNPFVSEPRVYVALYAGRVVAMRGLYGARWEFDASGESVFVPCASDAVMAPDHRDRGLYARLTAAALAELAATGHAYVVNLSAGPATIVSCLATGWRNAGSLGPLVRRSPAQRLLHKLHRLLKQHKPELDHQITGRYRALRSKRDPFGVLDRISSPSVGVQLATEPRPVEMAALAARRPTDRIRHVRNAAFLSWRFANPAARYRFLLHGSSRLDGYMVLQASRSSATVRIVDWMAANEHVQGELLRVAIDAGGFDTLSVWSATLPESACTLLEARGFESETPVGVRDDRAVLLVRAARDGVSPAEWTIGGRGIVSLSSWQLDMIDGDAY